MTQLSAKAPARDALFDNLKGLLIISVVYVHLYDLTAQHSLALQWLRLTILTVQMPLFLFLCGYFGKHAQKRQASAIPDYLLPYLIFNTLYYFARHMERGDLAYHVFVPLNMYWFLLTLLLLRLLLPFLLRIRGLKVLAPVCALLAGLDSRIGRTLSLSRTICFLPFYLLGYSCPKERVEQLRRLPVWAVVPPAAAASAGAWLLTRHFPVAEGKSAAYQLVSSYEAQGLHPAVGMLLRGSIYVFAPLLGAALLRVCPDQPCFLTRIGRNSMTVYLLHAFPVLAAVACLPMLKGTLRTVAPVTKVFFWGLPQLTWLLVAATGVAWLLSRQPVADTYRAAMGKIQRLVFLPADCVLQPRAARRPAEGEK